MNTLSMKKLAFGIVCAFAASAALFAGAPTVTVSGTVTDGSGHGWPLYARSRVHVRLDGSGRGVLRSRHRAVRGERRGRDHSTRWS